MPVVPKSVVEIQEESVEATTSGTYGTEVIAFDAPANTQTDFDVTLPIPISLLEAKLDAKGVNDGDCIGFDVAPETTVGVLDAAVAAAATVITVPQSVVDLFDAGTLWLGQHLILDGGGNKDDCGVVTAYDVGAKTLTVKVGTTNAFAVGHAIKITTSMSPAVLNSGWVEVSSGDSKVYVFGESKIGGSFIQAGKVIRIRYKNSHATQQARVRVNLEYLY
jgi:hypothetical protein